MYLHIKGYNSFTRKLPEFLLEYPRYWRLNDPLLNLLGGGWSLLVVTLLLFSSRLLLKEHFLLVPLELPPQLLEVLVLCSPLPLPRFFACSTLPCGSMSLDSETEQSNSVVPFF